RRFQRLRNGLARFHRVNDLIDPKTRGAVARVSLLVVGLLRRIEKLVSLFVAQLLAAALQLLDFDLHQRAGGGVSAHDRIFRGGPGEDEAGIIGFAAHGVVPGAERAADDHGDFGNDGVRHCIHHLRSRLDNAAPLGIASHHEAVDVVEKNERDQVLVAVHDEAGGFFGGLGVDDAAELDAFVAFVVSLLRVELLVGNDADGEASDASVAADEGFAILGLVLVEAALVHDARQNLLHVIRPRGRGIVGAVDFFGRHRWVHGLFAIPDGLAAVSPLFYERADAPDAGSVIRFAEVYRTADGGVHSGSA